MTFAAARKIPVQFEKPLKDYVAAFAKFEEMRKRPGVNVRALDDMWKEHQGIILQIEESLVNKFGKEVAEELLQSAIGVKTLPRVS